MGLGTLDETRSNQDVGRDERSCHMTKGISREPVLRVLSYSQSDQQTSWFGQDDKAASEKGRFGKAVMIW